MKLFNIDEPRLEFAQGTHVCPRAGIAEHNVYDLVLEGRRETIMLGAVGTSDGLEKLSKWLNTCSDTIPGKAEAKQPNLFPAFCGFNKNSGFKSTMTLITRNMRTLNFSDVNRTLKIADWNERVQATVALYQNEVAFLAQARNVDVILCVLPDDLYELIYKQELKPLEETIEDTTESLELNFRSAMKAATMLFGTPIQLAKEKTLEINTKGQQDDATKAWNFCTAIYYKASNQTVPWKLESNPNKPTVCFVGISFYKSRDRKILHTSLAQIFDELGNGVILRGTPVQLDKTDRQPHLSTEQSYQLLGRALSEYSLALRNFPARLVIHKSSNYNQAELEGLRAAVKEAHIGTVDFVTILDTDIKLFRNGSYPPYRGTGLELDKNRYLFYTRGSVEYYKTYPSSYIPQPLEVRIVDSDESGLTICTEILGLSKMNWNNTQFDGKYPITLGCARNVGKIMKYLSPDARPQIRYSFYM